MKLHQSEQLILVTLAMPLQCTGLEAELLTITQNVGPTYVMEASAEVNEPAVYLYDSTIECDTLAMYDRWFIM